MHTGRRKILHSSKIGSDCEMLEKDDEGNYLAKLNIKTRKNIEINIFISNNFIMLEQINFQCCLKTVNRKKSYYMKI